MKRALRVFAALLLLTGMAGCANTPAVDPDVKPELYFSCYQELTDLYGMTCRDALDALGTDLQAVEIVHQEKLGIPQRETYAGVEFAVYLRFNSTDATLYGIENEKYYQYPQEEEQMLRDIVSISRQLTEDFGQANDTSFVFNWVEVRCKETWNRDITYWQDIQVLKRLVDEGFSGELLYWDLTPVASQAVREEMKKYGDDARHGLSFYVNIDESNGTAVLMISY